MDPSGSSAPPTDAPSPAPTAPSHPARASLPILALAALGVVFGDIGTSPLYALSGCFATGTLPSHGAVMGALSLVFWTLLLVVSVKYVSIVMRADNKGEGGILALMALLQHTNSGTGRRRRVAISLLGILGAALLFSDGIITPAISVLSAIEGLTVISTTFQPVIIPLSIGVLAVLFSVQSRGTARVGLFFGPLLVGWFAVLSLLGLRAILLHPGVLAALNPVWAISFLVENRLHSLAILGAVFLTVTGAEVLYADLGHFGRRPITLAWFVLVFPALLLNYFGQGALLLAATAPVGNLFYALCPRSLLYPLILLATAATVVASQAVISGAFSLARQSVQLGFWPRILVIHTSSNTIGQVYVPLMNALLFVGTVGLILMFKESSRLGAAYGIAVSATTLITTLLMTWLALRRNTRPRWAVIALALGFLLLDVSFFAANLAKVMAGGWIVLLIAVVIVTMMQTWIRGRAEMGRIVATYSMTTEAFVADIAAHPPRRVEDTAVFLSASPDGVPRALLHNLKHNKVLHEQTIVLTVSTEDVPYIHDSERLTAKDYGNGFYRIRMRFGFSEKPDIPKALSRANIPRLVFHPMRTTYFLGRESIVPSRQHRALPLWMRRLYVFMAHNSLTAANFFSIPPGRVVELGAQNVL